MPVRGTRLFKLKVKDAKHTKQADNKYCTDSHIITLLDHQTLCWYVYCHFLLKQILSVIVPLKTRIDFTSIAYIPIECILSTNYVSPSGGKVRPCSL